MDSALGCFGVIFEAVINALSVGNHWRFWVAVLVCPGIALAICMVVAPGAWIPLLIISGILGLVLGAWWDYKC